MSLIDRAAALLNFAGSFSGARVDSDVPYGDHERQKLDIYPAAGKVVDAVLVFFYGGAWVKGSRDMYAFVGRSLASAGVTTIIPDYRLRQHADGASVEDGAKALEWVRANVARETFVCGHSAGAHIGASLSYDPQWQIAGIQGFIGMAGPYEYVRSIRRNASAPALLMVAGQDRLIPSSVAERFASRLRQAGGDAVVRTYRRASHATLVGALSPLLYPIGPVRADILDFVKRKVVEP